MWNYNQSTGELYADVHRIATGYSGAPEAKNDGSKEHIRNVGPIPKGLYEIGEAYNSKRVGPFCLPLTPVGHDAHGRTHFLIHGDSIKNPGTASKGCIILPRKVRHTIWLSGITRFMVNP